MSQFFDPQDKKNKPVLDYFENKTWLIVDTSASTRTSIKKSITQIGSKMSNMLDADNIVDAQKLIETKKPHFIIGHNVMHGGNLTSLFQLHLKTLTNRLEAGFFLLSEESGISEIALDLEYEMDGIISLPFTGGTIIDTVLSGAKEKISPTPYFAKVGEGRADYLKGNLERATELFETALSLHKHPYEAYFYLGEIYRDHHLTDKALKSYEDSFLHNDSFYKTLNSLSSLYFELKDYKKAYNLNFVMAQKFPTSPKKIPELIRLSIINKKYEDINNYLGLFKNVRAPDPETQMSLSAGLAILGKYFIHQNEIEKGVESLKIAYHFSNGKYEIISSLMQSFKECGKLEVLVELFEQTDLDSWNENIQGLYFHSINCVVKDDQYILGMGEQLLRKKIKDIYIFEGMIERSIKANRKIGAIEGLVLEASRVFPAKKEHFEKMLERARGH